MEHFEFVDVPVEPHHISRVIAVARAAAPFVVAPSNIDDHYDLTAYIHAAAFQSVKLSVLIDNNILTRAIRLASGAPISAEKPSRDIERITAAVMVFFLLGGFLVEPNIAIYEKAASSSHDDAFSQLQDFRIADHIAPIHYARLVTGEAEEIPLSAIEQARLDSAGLRGRSREENFQRVLNDWKFKYLFCLKAVEIWRLDIPSIRRIETLMTWMREQAFFSAVMLAFSFLLFSPRPPSKLLKGVGSSIPQRVLDGARNAAWDCVYAKQWARKAMKAGSDQIWFLCSADNALKNVSGALLADSDSDTETTLKSQLVHLWGESDGGHLAKRYSEEVALARQERGVRDARVAERVERIDEHILRLEIDLGIEGSRGTRDR